jgi:ferredoxin
MLHPRYPTAAPAAIIAAEQAGADDDDEEDPRVYTATIGKRTGIDFGCDLSLSWPYVLGLVPGGSAELNGQIEIGDQLLGVGRTSVVGAQIAEATQLMAESESDELLLTLFRGSRLELQQAVGFEGLPPTVTIRVIQPGQPELTFTAKTGCNLRDELIARKINVYRSLTRWTNCNGKQLCGTCIVDVRDGLDNCSRRSIDEASTLRENPASYRLSCITLVYGDVTVEVQSPVGAAQWTR